MIDSVDATTQRADSNRGFSLIELLIVIVILGVLATIVVFSVRRVTATGQTAACNADARNLGTAIEGYFALAPATAIPGDGSPDSQELALVGFQLLRAPSKFYEVNANGTLALATNSPCVL